MYTHHEYPETCVTDLWECVHPSCACRRNPQTAVETWAPGTSGVPSSSRGLFFLTQNPLVKRIERPQPRVHTWCRYPMQGLKPQGSCGDLPALCWAPPGPPIYFCVGGVGRKSQGKVPWSWEAGVGHGGSTQQGRKGRQQLDRGCAPARTRARAALPLRCSGARLSAVATVTGRPGVGGALSVCSTAPPLAAQVLRGLTGCWNFECAPTGGHV